jgi:hypothetical protein
VANTDIDYFLVTEEKQSSVDEETPFVLLNLLGALLFIFKVRRRLLEASLSRQPDRIFCSLIVRERVCNT